ncbi:hypothetical protein [Priestia filamentosa]|uniref:hypothetical protein n=1 Tax=Priestia filamentosa TaxID=1402861 RepID=UPI0002D4EE3C|nr:hypothetical protein [Priestia filamentosa]MDT3761851.1 hypothetical protein [Priestia filamentosa]WRU96360.1 hypothetical protein RYX51_04570 [Priestia filamentosa]SMF46142.1 hypothetical protein SAMN06296056_103375 [Priestia filamentosa]
MKHFYVKTFRFMLGGIILLSCLTYFTENAVENSPSKAKHTITFEVENNGE